MIENYDDGAVVESEADTDRTTVYVYDSAGRLCIQRAKDPKGSGNGVELQDTRYLYESSFDGSLVSSTISPDTADTDSSGTDQVKVTYDRLRRTLTRTDQRGVAHAYGHDSAGRLEADAVTNLGSSGLVDDSILRIERSYDDIGRLATLSSYDVAAGGDVVNQVAYEYDGWGNVIASQQAHDGAVSTGTPKVDYAYDDGASGGEAKYVRLESVTYPDGRVVGYEYGSVGGVDDVLSRVSAITDGTGSEPGSCRGYYIVAANAFTSACPNLVKADSNNAANFCARFRRYCKMKPTHKGGNKAASLFQIGTV